jgi:molybdopterin-guanine dinucleotide biosynthesis protein A
MGELLSGVVLAGGRSQRMGRDKAFLTVDGQSLIRRQAGLLQTVGCTDLIISGRPDVDYGVPATRTVFDHPSGAGPLAGLIAALEAAQHDWLLVLAVDLPRITADFLRTLLAHRAAGRGVVPFGMHGYEPLIACYPRAFLSLAMAAAERGDYSLQTLAAQAENRGLVARLRLSAENETLLTNWNTPGDFEPPGSA